MTYIIKDRNTPPRFYTGTGWSDDQQHGQRYPTQQAAEAAILKHKMPADAVQSMDTNELPAVENDGGKEQPT